MTEEATPAKVRPNDGLGVCHPERDEAGEHALLERAAAAAGLVVESWITWGGAWAYPVGAAMNADGEPPIQKWNPLDDDGDAFRLALALRISVWRDDDLMRVGTLWEAFAPGHDVAAIARRLIVRAAAMCSKAPNAEVTGRPAPAASRTTGQP